MASDLGSMDDPHKKGRLGRVMKNDKNKGAIQNEAIGLWRGSHRDDTGRGSRCFAALFIHFDVAFVKKTTEKKSLLALTHQHQIGSVGIEESMETHLPERIRELLRTPCDRKFR